MKGNHPAIIDPATFDYVQTELKHREETPKGSNCSRGFGMKIRCGDCGGWYTSVVWHSNDQYRRTIFRCGQKYKGEKKCETPHVTEEEIKKIFIQAVNKRLDIKEETIENLKLLSQVQDKTEELDTELERLSGELEAAGKAIRDLVKEQMNREMPQDEYEDRERKLGEKYDEIKKQIVGIQETKENRKAEKYQINVFTEQFESLSKPLTEFDDQLFRTIVRYITIYKERTATVTFLDGVEVECAWD